MTSTPDTSLPEGTPAAGSTVAPETGVTPAAVGSRHRVRRSTRAAAPSGPAPTPWGLLRSAPRLIWALVVLNGLFLACWSILAPTYHAPDEPVHVDAVVRLYEGLGWPPPAIDQYMTPNGLSAWVASPYGRPQTPLTLRPFDLLQSDAVPRDQRPDWDQLRAQDPPPRTNSLQTQQMLQHPPLYYAVGAAVLKALPGGENIRWDLWVGVLRLLSVAMGTLLPLIFWAAAYGFTGSRRAGLVAALVPFTIPQLSHISSVVNNDISLILFASLAVLSMVCVLRGNDSRSNAVFLGVATGLALFSKSLATNLVPMVVAAYLLRSRPADEPARWRETLRRPQRLLRSRALLALVVAFVCGGWWYAFQLARTGQIQPTIPDFPGGISVSGRLDFLDNAWQLVAQRFWGSFGWYEVNLPFRWAVLATVVVVLLAVLGVARGQGARRRLQLLLLLWPIVAAAALMVVHAYHYYLQFGRVLGLQGRYLFLGLAGLAVVLAAAVESLPARIRRWAPLVVVALAVLIQADAIRLMIDTFWTPNGQGLRQAWGSLAAHAIWSPGTIQVLVALTAVAAVVVVGMLVRDAVRRVGTS